MTLDEKVDALAGVVSMREIAAGRYHWWLTEALVRTDGSRQRLRAWARAGRLDGPRDLAYVGTGDGRHVATRVLRQLPPPVAWHISRSVVVIGLGHRGGLFTMMPLLPATDEARQAVILNGEPDGLTDDVCAHEFAHSWLSDVVPPESAITSIQHFECAETKRKLLAEWGEGCAKPTIEAIRLDEHRAATLAREWGFSGPAADPTWCMDRALANWRSTR